MGAASGGGDKADPPASSSSNPANTGRAAQTGLSSAEVAERRRHGQVDVTAERTSRPLAEILRSNIFTRFNFILGALLVVILALGAPQDALFGIILVLNALIGIAQELRAKVTLDRLAVLSAPRVRVLRDGSRQEIAVAELVAGDLVMLRPGDQLVADGVVTASADLQADESLLTGESVSVLKQVGDQLLSGSFVVAGSGDYQALEVGAEAYARKLAAEARQFALVRSELREGINRILRYVTWALGPVAVLVLASQLHARASVRASLIGTVAPLVGMVPQGLVLLTSIAFGVSAVALARRNVLVQQLPAVEGLARVDVVCLDKTGTLTDGSIQFDRLIPLDSDSPRSEAALGALADDENRNATLDAIGAVIPPPAGGWTRHSAVPFSSARKWSAVSFVGHGTWILGAPEMVLPPRDRDNLERAAALAANGHRVLALAWTETPLVSESLPDSVQAAALVSLTERLRPDSGDAIAYFGAQGVAVKVISGDSPSTVGAVASRAGVPAADEPVDARNLPEDLDALGDVLERRSVFGRVTPHQKQAMVKALQARGHAVAMTGDGVNDVLALKLADIGIAMGSGAPATKGVAELVLLDGRFSTMPGVVGEGRRVTANIERVATLYVTKTVWATLLAVAASVALLPFPLLPRHLTVIDSLAIGIPSFFLALAPNTRRYLPGFAGRVLRYAIPSGAVVAAAAIAAYLAAHARTLPLVQQRTAATLVILALSLCVLTLVAIPLTWRRLLLIGAMVAAFVVLYPVSFVRTFYELKLPHGMAAVILIIVAVGIVALCGFWRVSHRSSAARASAPVRIGPGGEPPGQ